MNQKQLNNILPDYKIIRSLGEGGMGEVFLAEDLNLSRKVAIKFLKVDDNPTNEILLKRFLNEAKILASLNHPNIVSIFNFGKKNKINYIIMEYVDGLNLHELLKKKRLTPLESTKILKKIVRGMGEAHAKGVLHRDIKPANIIINSTNEVKIVDFGISKNLRSDENDYTKDNHFIGTVFYMAPEIFLGSEPAAESDIFSIGVLFYEMLTGVNPFRGDNKFQIIEKIKTQQLILSDDIKTTIPFQLNLIFNKMVCIDKNNRYSDAKEIYKALMNLKDHSEGLSSEEDLEDEKFQNIIDSNQPLVLEESSDLNFSTATLMSEISNKPSIKEKSYSKSHDEEFVTYRKEKTQFIKPILIIFVALFSFYIYKNPSLKEIKSKLTFDAIASYLLGIKSYSTQEEIGNSSNRLASVISDSPADQTKNLVSTVFLEFPPAGSTFLYETKVIHEKTGKVLKKISQKHKIKIPQRGIASIEVETNDGKKADIIKVTANNFLPPFEFKDDRGQLTKLKISGNFNSIYPLAVGKTMEFTATSLFNSGSFVQMSQECRVVGEENILLKGSEYATLVVKCKDVNVKNPSETWTYYSPKLKRYVKKETRTYFSDGYHLETNNLVEHQIRSSN